MYERWNHARWKMFEKKPLAVTLYRVLFGPYFSRSMKNEFSLNTDRNCDSKNSEKTVTTANNVYVKLDLYLKPNTIVHAIYIILFRYLFDTYFTSQYMHGSTIKSSVRSVAFN